MAATRWRALAVGLLLLGGGAKGEAEKILLETVEEAPYQVYLQGALSGQAVTQLDCIFQHLEFAPVYRVTSPARAHLNLRKARVDGYFSAAPNPDIDRFADLSVPLLVKKWNSYSYAPELLNLPIWDQRLKIGVISGGNTMAWLDSRGVAPAMQAVSLEQLLELLHKGRVNLIVADEMALQEVLEDHPALPRPLQRFQQFTPLGVYFAKAFLRDNPGFLAEFDRRAESCRAPNPELNPQQLSALRSLIDGHLERWRQEPLLLDALAAAAEAPPPTPESLQAADTRWQEERVSGARRMIEQLLGSPLSAELRTALQDYPDLFNELFVADRYGRLLAAGDVTSDFFQGDERKFIASRDLPEDGMVIEPLDYDASTRQFAVKVSGPVYGGTPRTFLGVLTFGVRLGHLF